MDITGKCKLLKIYVNEDARYEGASLYHAIVLRLRQEGLAGATVIRGIEGFGQGKRLHSTHILDLSLSLPIVIEAIDTAERIGRVIPIVRQMTGTGLLFVTDVEVLQYGSSDDAKKIRI